MVLTDFSRELANFIEGETCEDFYGFAPAQCKTNALDRDNDALDVRVYTVLFQSNSDPFSRFAAISAVRRLSLFVFSSLANSVRHMADEENTLVVSIAERALLFGFFIFLV